MSYCEEKSPIIKCTFFTFTVWIVSSYIVTWKSCNCLVVIFYKCNWLLPSSSYIMNQLWRNVFGQTAMYVYPNGPAPYWPFCERVEYGASHVPKEGTEYCCVRQILTSQLPFFGVWSRPALKINVLVRFSPFSKRLWRTSFIENLIKRSECK